MRNSLTRRKLSPGLWLIAALLCLLLVPCKLMAQLAPLEQRDSLIAELNSKRSALAIDADSTTGDFYYTADLTSLGDLILKRYDNGCDTIRDSNPWDSLSDILLMHDHRYPEQFMLRVPVKGPSTVKIPPGSHRLVCDLNAWLWLWWGSEYTSTSNALLKNDGDNIVGSRCDPVGQIYFMGQEDIGDPTARMRDTLNKYGSPWWINGYEYTIPKNSGGLFNLAARYFSEIVTVNKFSYIARRYPGAGGDVDTFKARPAYMEYQVPYHSDVVPPPTTVNRLVGFNIKLQTQKYPSEDCLDPLTMDPEPLIGEARVTLTIEYLPPGSSTHYFQTCTKAFNGSPSTDPVMEADSNNHALWDFTENWKFYSNILEVMMGFEIDASGFLFLHKLGLPTVDFGCPPAVDTFWVCQIRDPQAPAEYCETPLPVNGRFCIDPMSGEIVYKSQPGTTPPSCSSTTCTTEAVPCLTFCEKLSGFRAMTGVIAAGAQAYSDEWPYDHGIFGGGVPGSNRYETGDQGKWRPRETFAYKTNIIQGNAVSYSNERNYLNAGVFANDVIPPTITDAFRLFDWRDEKSNTGTKWLKVDTVTKFSPFGEAMEERDILGVYSSAQFSHKNTVPRLIAKNAQLTATGFNSFEDGAGNIRGIAHSGLWSRRLALSYGDLTQDTAISLRVDNQLQTEGILIKAWVKRTYHSTTNLDEIPIEVTITPSTPFRLVAQTGEWTLYELELPDLSLYTLDATLALRFKNVLTQTEGSEDTVWIDDVRAQPRLSEMICYVYDPNTLRLAAQFDDQHFAQFYQYNGEGKLVRKKRETERGIKTIAETQYHTPRWLMYSGSVPGINPQGGSSPSFGINPGASDGVGLPSGSIGTPSGVGADFDIFNIEVSPDGTRTTVFGSENPTLPDFDSLQAPEFSIPKLDQVIDSALLKVPSIDADRLLDVAAFEKVKIVREIDSIDGQIRALQARKLDGLSESEQREIESLRKALESKRSQLIHDKLGISEEEFRQTYESLKDPDADSNQSGGAK